MKKYLYKSIYKIIMKKYFIKNYYMKKIFKKNNV